MNEQDKERVKKETSYYLKASIFHFLFTFSHLSLLCYLIHLYAQNAKWWIYPLTIFEIFWTFFHTVTTRTAWRNFCYLTGRD